jgi:hypothetical protein
MRREFREKRGEQCWTLVGGQALDLRFLNAGEVSILDNVLASKFGVTNIGGAMHIDTLTDTNLVVTGRTYNQVDGGGTYGQYISAVTIGTVTASGSTVDVPVYIRDLTGTTDEAVSNHVRSS